MKKLLIFGLILLLSINCIAQPGMGDPPSEIPITDDIEILVFAGLLLGVYSIIRYRRISGIKKISKVKK